MNSLPITCHSTYSRSFNLENKKEKIKLSQHHMHTELLNK